MKTSRSKTPMPTARTLSFPVLTEEASLSTLRAPTGLLSRVWGWIRERRDTRSSSRRLRIAETVSLGEKRFVAVVQVDGRHFLLAGGPTNIALLAQLDPNDDFENVLKKTLTSRKQPAKRRRPASASDRSNLAPQAQLNGNKPSAEVLKKATVPNKQSTKRTRKQKALPEQRSHAPLSQVNGTEAFGDALKNAMTATNKQSAKQAGKLNPGRAIERIGEYA
jgi:flagellar biogenesis protein FliO